MKPTVYILCWLVAIIFANTCVLYIGTFFTNNSGGLKFVVFGLVISFILPSVKILTWIKQGRLKIPRTFTGWRYQLPLWSLAILLPGAVLACALLVMTSVNNEFLSQLLQIVFVLCSILCLIALAATEIKEIRKNSIQRY